MSNFHDPLRDIDPEEFIRQRKERYETAQQEFVRVFTAQGDVVSHEDVKRPTWDAALIGKLIQDLDKAKPNLKQVKPVSLYELESGEILFNVHKPEKCAGRPCAIHGASEHPLAEKPRSWVNGLIYRTCDHGVAHPDFDSLAARLDASGWVYERHQCCAGTCCGIPEVVDINDEEK